MSDSENQSVSTNNTTAAVLQCLKFLVSFLEVSEKVGLPQDTLIQMRDELQEKIDDIDKILGDHQRSIEALYTNQQTLINLLFPQGTTVAQDTVEKTDDIPETASGDSIKDVP